jgi:hypothetical protein
MEDFNSPMHQNDDERLLKKCRALIEEKLSWGAATTWTNQDLEILRDKIESETGVNLSIATLKRIWGKVKYSSKPTVTTLDTLVQFLGYENWRVFRVTFVLPEKESTPSTDETQTSSKQSPVNESNLRDKRISRWVILVCAILAVVALVFFLTRKSANTIVGESTAYEFTSKKILSSDVPNSVIFEYDAGNVNEEDTVFIQQSWDKRLQTRVPTNENHHTSIYYYPGFFQAKLIVNNKIVSEHDIFIPTGGWLALIEHEPVPVYLNASGTLKNGVMSIPIDTLKANNVPLQPQPPWVAFHNARTFDNLRFDNFIFETAVRNDFQEGSGVCQLTEIHIRFEGGMLMIPLSAPGCVSAIALYDVDGKKPDPSGLGCDLSDWVRIRCEVSDGKGILFINEKKVYDLNLTIEPKRIIGLLFRFHGTGSVDYVKLSDVRGNLVFEDTF